MYQITCDDNVIYDVRSQDRIVTSPRLTLETGKNGTLSFRIPKTNPCFDLINLKKSIFRVFQVDIVGNQKIYTQIFRGAANTRDEDFYSRGQIEIEGELSFFNDTIVRKYNYNGSVLGLFQKYVNEHNARVDDSKKFYVRNCTVTDPNNYITRANENYPTTKEEMDNKLIELLGGHFETEEVEEDDGNGNLVKKVYIDYLADYTEYNTQPIVFGRNMLDFTKCISAENIKTVIIPLGKKEEDNYVTIASVNDGKDYIEDTTAVNIFGRIEGIVKHDDVTVPSNLLSKGRKDLEDSIQLSTTININAADLHELDVNIEALRVGRLTRVVSIPHKWDRYMLLTKLELNLDDIKSSRITLGQTYKSFTEKQIKNQNQMNVISQSIVKVETLEQDVSAVKEDVRSINTVIVEIPTEYAKNSDFTSFRTEVLQKIGRVYTIKGNVANYAALDQISVKEIRRCVQCFNNWSKLCLD
ncbi:MAG: phage tail protein [Clostridia bacterium]|nr:phage tail protein [Clostridia bacterium]